MVPKETKLANGFILISRSLLESDIWKKPPLYLKVWIYLLTKAQHREYKQLKRGQLFTTVNEIRDACTYYVGCRKEAPTKDQIYKVLRWMSVEISTSIRNRDESNNEGVMKAPMIAITKATHGMVITICNFNVYQDPTFYESNNESNDDGSTKALRKRSGTNNINEECNKNDKNDKGISKDILHGAGKPASMPGTDTGEIFIELMLNNKSLHPVYVPKVREWEELYPSVDVEQELRKMKGWIDSNPARRKTARGINAFITSWLAKAQDRGGAGRNKDKPEHNRGNPFDELLRQEEDE